MPRRVLTALCVLAVLGARPLGAQRADSAAAPPAGLVTAGSPAEELWRLGQLLGVAPSDGFLLRSPSSATPHRRGLTVLPPELLAVWNSAIPYSVNDGALWAGKGGGTRLMAGVAAEAGPVRLILAPEVAWSENRSFDGVLPRDWSPEQRAILIPPWESGRHSVDLPYRQGTASLSAVHPGQSSLSLTAGPLVVGAATENQWWGPGVRNAILLSSNAAGFPHLFVRTAAPLRTPLGRLEGRWLVGELTPSRWFTAAADSGRRSLAALGLTLQPGAGLTLGVARAVYSPAQGSGEVAGRFADVLGHWDAGRDSSGRAAEQMLALSARWLAPGDGAEVYFEWARRELPTSLRDLLLQPEHSQGYTLGGQFARPAGARGALRLQGEMTYLEESPTFRARAIGSYYASARVPQGYTQRGEVVGAAVGPAGSSQWLAADYLSDVARLGVFLGRVRWANDSYYDKPGGNSRYRGHDVTLLGGARAGVALGAMRLDAEWTWGKRLNYLFQNYAGDWDQRDNAVNVSNHTLQLRVSPRPAPLGPRRSPRPVEATAAEPDGGAPAGRDAPDAVPAPPRDGRGGVTVGSELERYLRVLQVGGAAPRYPWSARGFSPREVDRVLPDSAHPWSARYRLRADTGGGVQAELLGPAVTTTYNSAFPYGGNDGPVWTGRGATVEGRAGVALRYGALSLRIEPVAFWSQNRAFELMPNGQADARVYADARSPTGIDLPQRFGDEPYGRIDPGESTLRLDLLGVAVGASTASQQWGPAWDLPVIMGNNAGGFPHLFAGTSVPVNVGIGRVHGRVIWGRLEQSAYSPVQSGETSRFGTGIVGVFTPRGLPGLEVGVSRFFHIAWPQGGPGRSHWLKVFESVGKAGLDSTGIGPDGKNSPDNQLASAFFRWVFPRAGLEVYGELGRDDHSWDFLDWALEPDHSGGYVLGIRKVWRSEGSLLSLHAETMNTEVSHILRVRNQGPFYRHTFTPQGHTQRGQLLGAPSGYGGGGSVVGLDLYRPAGRWSVRWTRERVGARWNYWQTGVVDPRGTEVIHSLGGEGLFFGGAFDVLAGATAAVDLNRNHQEDVFNLSLRLGVQLRR